MYTAPGTSSASLHLMISKEGDGDGAQLDFPGGMNPAHRLPQQWMHRLVVQVLGRFLGFVPVALGLPRVQGKFDESRGVSADTARPTRSDGRDSAVRQRNSSACDRRPRCAAGSPERRFRSRELRLSRTATQREPGVAPARRNGCIRHRASVGSQVRKEPWRGCFATSRRRRRHSRPVARRSPSSTAGLSPRPDVSASNASWRSSLMVSM